MTSSGCVPMRLLRIRHALRAIFSCRAVQFARFYKKKYALRPPRYLRQSANTRAEYLVSPTLTRIYDYLYTPIEDVLCHLVQDFSIFSYHCNDHFYGLRGICHEKKCFVFSVKCPDGQCM